MTACGMYQFEAGLAAGITCPQVAAWIAFFFALDMSVAGNTCCGALWRMLLVVDVYFMCLNKKKPVRFFNQLKLKCLGRSHPVHVAIATAAVVTHQQRKLKNSKKGGKG